MNFQPYLEGCQCWGRLRWKVPEATFAAADSAPVPPPRPIDSLNTGYRSAFSHVQKLYMA